MNSIKEIETNNKDASSARCVRYMGIVIAKSDGNVLQGEVKLKDGTIARFKDGLLDGNVYSEDGSIIESKPALEYEFGGVEFCKKGVLDGFPAVIQNYGYLEEDWKEGELQKIRTEVEIEEIE